MTINSDLYVTNQSSKHPCIHASIYPSIYPFPYCPIIKILTFCLTSVLIFSSRSLFSFSNFFLSVSKSPEWAFLRSASWASKFLRTPSILFYKTKKTVFAFCLSCKKLCCCHTISSVCICLCICFFSSSLSAIAFLCSSSLAAFISLI